MVNCSNVELKNCYEAVKGDDSTTTHTTDIIGEWGPFQRKIVLIITTLYVISPFQNIAIVFFTPNIDFWCERPVGYENATKQLCQRYEDATELCTQFEYDLKGYRSTIIDEFDLVCDRSWLISLTKSIYQFGILASSICFGLISDRYGRSVAMKIIWILEIVSALSQGMSRSITQFIVARFFLGMASYGRYLTGTLMIIEIVGPSKRGRITLVYELGYYTGQLLLSLIMYYVQHFRYLQFIIVGYELLFVVAIWTFPESPRWQLTHGRIADAEKTIISAAKQNGVHDEETVKYKLEQLKNFVLGEENRMLKTKSTIVGFWRVPSCLRIAIIHYVIFILLAFTAYGFNYNIGDIGGNLFANIAASSVGGMVCVGLCSLIIERFGRRKLAAASSYVSAIVVLAYVPFILNATWTPYLAWVVFFGKLMNIDFVITYLIATELFPTSLRQITVGSCSVFARVGSICAPFVKELTEATHIWVTLVMFSILNVVQGSMFFLLPETKGTEIPNTIEEADEFYRSKGRRERSALSKE